MSDEDDDDDSHPTLPPLTPSRQQPNNLTSSLYLNQLPLNEILKDMRFGNINPEEIQSVRYLKEVPTKKDARKQLSSQEPCFHFN
jgi:hypothetical protein